MIDLPENIAIELHDSVVGRVDQIGERIEICLMPAYVHKSIGVCGVDAGTGWVQNITLVVDGGIVEGELPELPCDISTGILMVNEHISKNMLSLPLDQVGNIDLKLDVMWGGQIVVRGKRIVAIPKNEAKYVENVE
jgi:hypothetical protein